VLWNAVLWFHTFTKTDRERAWLKRIVLSTPPPNTALQLTASREIVRILKAFLARSRQLNAKPLATLKSEILSLG
jgi:hypothetical protein